MMKENLPSHHVLFLIHFDHRDSCNMQGGRRYLWNGKGELSFCTFSLIHEGKAILGTTVKFLLVSLGNQGSNHNKKSLCL